jgi:hypothetical protein
MACYRDRAQGTRNEIHALEARAQLDPAYRARRIASLEASAEADTRQQHVSALIAASDDAVAGDVTSAKALAEIASEDPALADRVAKLRSWLDSHPPRPTRARP